MTLRNLIYPIVIASAISYGCSKNEHQRFQNLSREEKFEECRDSVNRLQRDAIIHKYSLKKSFPDTNFSCEIFSEKRYKSRKQ